MLGDEPNYVWAYVMIGLCALALLRLAWFMWEDR